MTSVLVDTSVLITWFHASGEAEVAEAGAIRDPRVRGDLDARVLDLAESASALATRLRLTR